MTPKMKSPFELKPEEMYVFDNEDAEDISEAPDHLEVSTDAEILMEIYKLRKPGAILHSVHSKAMVVSHLFRGNEYRLRYHAMIQVIYSCVHMKLQWCSEQRKRVLFKSKGRGRR